MLGVADVQGLWRRALIAWPDGRRDDTSRVDWLQGPSCFADLRTPAHRPSFGRVAALHDLDAAGVGWLAAQEGFAGHLGFDGTAFEWRRVLDYQPATGQSDAGLLRMEGVTLIETGRDVPYVEHWLRAGASSTRSGALRLCDAAEGCDAFVVWAGDDFIYARDRQTSLPEGASLADCVAGAASLAAARAMVDCEISVGRIAAGAWRVARSSLPHREGAAIALEVDPARGGARSRDVAADGRPFERDWTIIEREGDAAAAAAQAASIRGCDDPNGPLHF